MIKSKNSYIAVAIGIIILLAGLYMVKAAEPSDSFMKALPYVLIGIGSGIFGHSMGNVVSNKAMENDPEAQKQLEIEKNDERNIAIGNRAKASAYDMMTFVFGALLLCFALMGVAMEAVILFVCAYLFVEGYGIYCRFKYDKEM